MKEYMDVKTLQKVLESMKADIHTLDSKIILIAQKLKTMEKNEEIIGRTIVMHNEKIRKFEENSGNVSTVKTSGDMKADIDRLNLQIKQMNEKISEMKYILDSINPLEFATIYQVKDLIKDLKEDLSKKGK